MEPVTPLESITTDAVRLSMLHGLPLEAGLPHTSAGGGTFVYLTSFLQLNNWMRVFYQAGVEHMLCVDTETTGLHAVKDKLLLLQLHAPGTPCLIIDCRAIPLNV